MSRRLLVVVVLGLALGCGGDDNGGGPVAPSGSVTAVTIAQPAGAIFIGSQTQFQATSTFANGTTAASVNPAWGSDAPAVATVSSTGMVTAVAAGEATIFADVNPRGSLRVRVLPHFQGTWSGAEVVTTCEETGEFKGLLCEDTPVGTLLPHDAKFTQTNEAVAAQILFGDSASTMNGTVTVGGELQLPPALVLPAIPGVTVMTQNYRARADVPSQLTGVYEWVFTAPGVSGQAKHVYRLASVIRTSTTTGLASGNGGADKDEMLRRLARKLEASR